jgi:hypothetical protein
MLVPGRADNQGLGGGHGSALERWLPRPTIAGRRRATGVGTTYSIEIKHGCKIPHPRLYVALAGLAGVNYSFN